MAGGYLYINDPAQEYCKLYLVKWDLTELNNGDIEMLIILCELYNFFIYVQEYMNTTKALNFIFQC